MTNLLRNPRFTELVDGKTYYNRGNDPGLAVPHDWVIGFYEQQAADSPLPVPNETFPLPTQDDPFRKPETVVWRREDAPADEVDLLFGNLPYVVKIFKGFSPIWILFYQFVTLDAGRRYRFSVEVYPDLVASWEGVRKIFAPDPLSGEFRLEPEGASSLWQNGDLVPFGQWITLAVEFVAAANDFVGLEFRGRHGLANNGLFVRNPQLIALDAPPDEPLPPPPPTPTPDTTVLEKLAEIAAYLDIVQLAMARVETRLAEIKAKLGL